MITRVYICLPLFILASLPMFTRVYSCLAMFALIYLCLHLYSHVHLLSRVYLCLPLFTCACLTMITKVYSCLPKFSTVNSCLPMFTNVYSCLFTHIILTVYEQNLIQTSIFKNNVTNTHFTIWLVFLIRSVKSARTGNRKIMLRVQGNVSRGWKRRI